MARVLVTDAHLGSAVSVIRSLGRCGHHVIAAGSDASSPGLRSRFAAERLLYADPERDPHAMRGELLRAVGERRVDLLVPVTDDVILPIVEQRPRFEEHCALALAPPAALAAARDKDATMALGRRLGVPTPRSALVTTAAEARRHARELGWPLVVKPQASRVLSDGGPIRGLPVTYAGGFASLTETMRQFTGVSPVLLQDYHPGEALGVELLMHEGRPLAAFQHRRLHEVPITGGASSFRESAPLDPVLYDHSVRLLAALEWTGLAMVEFKVGPEGPRLMEINGRIWGSLPLAVKSGMDFPARMAALHLSGPPPPDEPPATSYRVGVRSRNLDLEVLWIASVLRKGRRYPFLSVPRRRDALRAASRLLSPSDGYDIVTAQDPGPGLAEIMRIGAKLPRKVAGAR
jgi:predicted ATP-grasp superfamily ATP-dependent carboligase